MESKKLDISQLFEGIKIFVKEEFKRLDTWAMLTIISYLGAVGLTLLSIFCIGLDVIYFVFNYSNIVNFFMVFNVQEKPVIFIISGLITLVALFITYKTMKKAIGIGNIIMVNILAAVQNKTLPKFSQRDERLSFILYIFLFFIGIILGSIFLIVPGVIFFIRCCFGYLIMLDQKCSPLEALKRSWNMTEGNFWPIFIFIIPIFLIQSLIPLIALIFMFIPLNLWIQAYIYNQLKEQE